MENLVGTWKGKGKGIYPTIEPFEYEETLVIEKMPKKPVYMYTQKTISLVNGDLMHLESGFIRNIGNKIELVLAAPNGLATIEQGSFDQDGVLKLSLMGIYYDY